MSRTVSCPNCKLAQPVEDQQGEPQAQAVCRACGHPLGLDPEAAAASRQATILWIDDDRLLLSFGRDVLEEHGYRVLTAPDGPSGIATAKNERPDLIILDVLMPNMDGYEVCRRLRADPGLKDTPVFLLTALEDPQVEFWGREVGATFAMSKPSDPDRIVSTIEQMLRWKPGRQKL